MRRYPLERSSFGVAFLCFIGLVPGVQAGVVPWSLPADSGLMANPGCFGELTCSDRIVLSRISSLIAHTDGAKPADLISREMSKLGVTQSIRILKAIAAGAAANSLNPLTDLSLEDWNNVEQIESLAGIQSYISTIRSDANRIADESRRLRDEGWASQIWTLVAYGTSTLGRSVDSLEPDAIPLVRLSKAYNGSVQAILRFIRDRLGSIETRVERREAMIASYKKRIDQLSQQLSLEVRQASGAFEESQAAAIFPLEIVAEAGLFLDSFGTSSYGLSAAKRMASLAGFASSAENFTRAAHAAYASNNTSFYCQIAEETVRDPVAVKMAVAGVSTLFLGRVVAAGHAGIRAMGGVVGAAGLLGSAAVIEYGRLETASEFDQLAQIANSSGKSEDEACFRRAQNDQFAGIAIDIATLGAGYLTERVGVSPKLASPLPKSTSSGSQGENSSLLSAIRGFKTFRELMDGGLFANLWIDSEISEQAGGDLLFTLTSRSTHGKVKILIPKGNESVLELTIAAEESEAMYRALVGGTTYTIRL